MIVKFGCLSSNEIGIIRPRDTQKLSRQASSFSSELRISSQVLRMRFVRCLFMRRFSPPKSASGKLVSAPTSCARMFPSRSSFHLCKSLVALWWALMFLRSPPSPKTCSPCHASLSRSCLCPLFLVNTFDMRSNSVHCLVMVFCRSPPA